MVLCFALNMVLKLEFEFLEGLVPLCLNVLKLLLELLLNGDLVRNVPSTVLPVQVSPSDMEEGVTLNLWFEKGIVKLGDDILTLDFFDLLKNPFA